MTMKLARFFLALGLVLAGASAGAAPLEVIVFPGGFNWPLWIAQDKGFFAENGLEVKITPTPGSIFQMQNLAAGKFDIAFSNYDNVVAYMEGQGEAPLPQPADFFVFMGVQYGAVRLVANPDVKSIADFKGKSLAVDAATTGYAFVLRKMLQQGGLGEDDYTFDKVGSTSQRAEALMQNKTAGTILTTPLEILPESKGYKRLANATETVGPYTAVSGVALRSWAKSHRAELVGFIKAYVRALDWIADPANRAEAIAIYRKNIPAASEASALKAWELLTQGSEGFAKRARLDRAGMETVLKLRSEFGRPQKQLADVDKYVDESYYREAVR
jgi:ABC-type nitrate/sulfonate/bicarbonate transport system substrate-binding protein